MEGNSITSFENLCKIFEMRIKLDREKGIKTPTDILDNYEKYSMKIDAFYNSKFQKELKSLISPAVTIEKEEDRLRRLIKLLEDRLEKRKELEDRYYDSTGEYILGLQIIVSESELEDKRDRLSLISKYLETNKEIEDVTDSINKLKDLLVLEEEKREEYVSKNEIMEDELCASFMSTIKDDEYFKNSNVSETKETLDITKESVGALADSGLSEDYASYIEEAEKNYYSCKYKEILLKIYKLVVNFEEDFKLICGKRENISDLLLEMKELRDYLSIETEDVLYSFEKCLLVQNKTLDNEREVIENITNYTSRIEFKEERLEELNDINSSTDILSILREYGLIETYDIDEEVDEKLDLFEEEKVIDEPIVVNEEVEENPSFETLSTLEYNPYRIVEVKDYPKTLNVGLARLKGESVREKVNKKLNPKISETTFDGVNSSALELEVSLDNNLELNNSEEEKIKEEIENKDSVIENSIPVWGIPTEPVVNNTEVSESLPIWEVAKPVFEISNTASDNISNIDILM